MTGKRATVDPLGMSTDEFKAMGHWLVDRVAESMENLDRQPVISEARPRDFAALGGPPPLEPTPLAESLDLLSTLVLSNMQHGNHPRYFARVPGPSSHAAILGEWISVGFNSIAASWGGGSGPTAVELAALDWLRDLLALPAQAEGVLVSGGSIGNLTALATARSAGYDGPVLISDQTHSSVARAIRMLGWSESEIRTVPTAEGYRWHASDVADELSKCTRAIVVATAGTTNTGAVDPLDEIADLCQTHDAWLHVDGAYGAPAAMTAEGAALFRGLERADSLTLDPHKWLFQPYDIGCVLVTRPGALERCFSMTPEYLKDVSSSNSDEVDMRNRGPELSRRGRGIKLWLTFRTYGATRIIDAIAEGIKLAEYAQELVVNDPYWDLVTPAQLGILTFAAKDLDNDEHERRAHALTDDGFAAVSCTELAGRRVFRLCVINPRTSPADLRETIARLRNGR